MDTSKETIDSLLTRGVVDCDVRENLKKRLLDGDKLRVKLGIDPTGKELHLGHSVILRKLRDFQNAGHKIVLIIGTFTGKIGDPTGKDQARAPLTDKQIVENMKDFLNQAGKVFDVKKAEIVKNGDWLNDMTFKDVIDLASTFTVQQMIQRDMYQRRLQQNKEISLHEFLYPLMQGYDSVAIKADLELGGTDQLFNLMAGRQIQKRFNKKPQDIMTLPILLGLDGKEKMSKSLNNYIGLNDSPREMFGKTMSISDNLMSNWFELLTRLPMQEVKKIISGHPRDAKLRLATEIVTEFYGDKSAEQAKDEFLRMFQDKGLPDDIKCISLKKGKHTILDIVIASSLCVSNGEAKRMIAQGAVKIDDQRIDQLDEQIEIAGGELVLQVGKRKFVKIKSK